MAFANFSITNIYTAILTALNAQLTSVASWFRDQTTGDFTNQVRYNSASMRIEYWTGTAWAELDISAQTVNNAATVGGFTPSQRPGVNQIPVFDINKHMIFNAANGDVFRFATPYAGGFIEFKADSATTDRYVCIGMLDNTGTPDVQLKINDSGIFQYQGHDVWHSGNDGAGSGLDADLLDGKRWVNIAAGTATISAGGFHQLNLRTGGAHHYYRVSVYGAAYSFQGNTSSPVNNTIGGWSLLQSPAGADLLTILAPIAYGDTAYYSVDVWE